MENEWYVQSCGTSDLHVFYFGVALYHFVTCTRTFDQNKRGWKLALGQVSKLLGRVQIVDFLLHFLKTLPYWLVLSK